MKKLLTLLLAFTLVCPAAALAEARIPVYRVDEALLFFNKSTGEITGFAGEPGWLTIPAYIAGNKVNSIGNGAFANCQSLRKIVIEEGPASIGDSAFENCRGLMEVQLPASLTSIGELAFGGCEALKTAGFAGAVDSVASNAFEGTPWLMGGEEFVIAGKTVLMKYNGSAKDVIVPEGVKKIASAAFARNADIERVSLPEGLASIEDNAFVNCQSLVNIDFPKSLSFVGVGAFDDTPWLRGKSEEFVSVNGILVAYNGGEEYVSVPNGITSIGGGVFMSNDKILAVFLPDSLISINAGAFGSCPSLSAVVVPDGVQFIDNFAFTGSNMTLFGSDGSYAESFAELNGCAFSAPVSVDVNGRGVFFDVPPVIINGSAYVPMRAALESLGLSVEWNGADMQAAVTNGKTTVTAFVGSSEVDVNGRARTISSAPIMLGGRVLLPVRAFAEIFGFDVDWDNSRRSVIISTGKPSPVLSTER